MSQRESSAAIDDVAARWAAWIDRAPLTPEESAELEAWLVKDSRRRGAFARARAVMLYADRARALGEAYDPAKFVPVRTISRPITRRWALAGGALAASGVAGVVGLEAMMGARRYQTARGEVRLVPLADGSVVTLNTATEVAVKFSDDRRNVKLIDGEALFNVAKNPQRPFIVDAGDVQVKVVGTSFTVRKLPGQATQVLVREGVVEVLRQDHAEIDAAPVRLIANQRAVAAAGAPIKPLELEPAAVERQLVWNEGMISFEGASLNDAAKEFARYSDPRIVIDDPGIADETITGLFSADNPAGFAKAVALSLNIEAHAEDGVIHLRR